MIALKDIQYTKLNATVHCATASLTFALSLITTEINLTYPIFTKIHVTSSDLSTLRYQLINLANHQSTASGYPHSVDKQTLGAKKIKRDSQRAGVRLLLQKLLTELNITDTLDETAFPYRLNNHRYYVCFSHSADKVAVALSYENTIGVDVEVNVVAWQVAKRFYHPDEITMLERLPTAERDHLVKLLWQLKESLIKINQDKLAVGLGRAYLPLIRALIDNDSFRSSLKHNNFLADNFSIDMSHHYEPQHKIAFLLRQQTVVVF